MDLPTGTITLVFTDIQDSSVLSERYRIEFEKLRAAHFRLLREAMQRWNGIEVNTAGDSLFVVFDHSADAVQWAIDVQRRLSSYDWPLLANTDVADGHPVKVEIRVRIGMHTGEPYLSMDGGRSDYFGPVVNRAARVSSAAYGGQILVSSATRAVVQYDLPRDITFRDRGLHRLKGVGEDQLWQVDAPFLIQEFPPLKTLDPRRHNLPVPPQPYVGREAEMRAWLDRLREPATRVLTLTGFGGIGKTRTALQLAELSLDDFPDGAWWVNTEEARIVDEIFERVSAALGLPSQTELPVREQVIRYLSERKLLLILDNLEQVPDAGRAVIDMVARAPGVKLLVTSRRTLDIQAERVIELYPLSTSEAAQLFLSRARDRQGAHEITPEIAADVNELCERLDGIPLALELAASRASMMTPRQMLQRLNERFKLLQTRAPGLPERQRALRAAIDWSYDLLTDDDKSLFGQLSVFAGGFTLEDAEAVCDSFDVLEGIAELRRQSLLRTITETGAPQARYLMLNSLREYAQERLNASDIASETRLRHARYFLVYARSRLAQMRSAAEPQALKDITANADNLRAAIVTARNEGDTQLFAQLGLVCGKALYRLGFAGEALRPVEVALNDLEPMREDHPALYAELQAERAWIRLLNLHGARDSEREDTEIAEAQAKEALELFQRIGDRLGRARTENLLGYACWLAGRHMEGRGYFESALGRLRSPEDDTDIGNLHTQFGILISNEPGGDPREAVEHLQEAIRIRRKKGDRRGLAEALNNLGIVAFNQQDWARAWEQYAEALQYEQELDNSFGAARILFNLAEVAQARSETMRCLKLAIAAEKLMEAVKSPLAQYATALIASAAKSGIAADEVDALRKAASPLSLSALIDWAIDDSEKPIFGA